MATPPALVPAPPIVLTPVSSVVFFKIFCVAISAASKAAFAFVVSVSVVSVSVALSFIFSSSTLGATNGLSTSFLSCSVNAGGSCDMS